MIAKTPANKRTAKATKSRKSHGHPRQKSASGVIEDGKTYYLNTFCDILGITPANVTEMRRRGFVTRKDGKRVVILGSDYLRYVGELPLGVISQRSVTTTETSPCQ